MRTICGDFPGCCNWVFAILHIGESLGALSGSSVVGADMDSAEIMPKPVSIQIEEPIEKQFNEAPSETSLESDSPSTRKRKATQTAVSCGSLGEIFVPSSQLVPAQAQD